MKKLIFLTVIGYVAWSYFNQNIATETISQVPPKAIISAVPPRITSVYSCDGRQHCRQMSSYKEAVYFINNCPNTKMDGDHDGIPCERQFNH